MNMRLPKSLRDKDPLLGDLPQADMAMEYSDHEWTAEELEDVDRQVYHNIILSHPLHCCGKVR